MSDMLFVLELFQRMGETVARSLQQNAPNMTSTEIIAAEDFLPDFNPNRQYLNFSAGYICRTPDGNVVKLLQPYDSLIYPEPPEQLPAQWGFHWSTDPKKAKPFMKISTSPYNKGECCVFEGKVWRSVLASANVYSPSEYPQGWENLGPTGNFV